MDSNFIVSPCQLPSLPRPSTQPSYAEEWKKNPRTNVTVFGLAWQMPYLVGVTSCGDICTWSVPIGDDNEEDSNIYEMDIVNNRRPIFKVQVTNDVLYNIRFVPVKGKMLLFVSGDEGLWAYDWRDWIDLLQGRAKESPSVVMHFKPHPSPYTTKPEINDFDIWNDKWIFGAAGDAFGGYKWDMETQKLVANYTSLKRGYLHTIKCTEDGTVLTGGEDGVLGVWDNQHDKLIDNVDLKSSLANDSSLLHREQGSPPWHTKATTLWISHIQSSSANWWTVCGGVRRGGTGGHVSLWHAPTRSLVTGGLTRETPQFMCITPLSLITVANEGVVSHWSPSTLQRTNRVWCSPPSAFAAAIRPDDSCLAVGGVGDLVDIFDNLTDKSYCLTHVESSTDSTGR